MRPFIDAILMSWPSPSATVSPFIKSKSLNLSSSASSATPVVLLQNPILGRIYKLSSTPQFSALHVNALPCPHSSPRNGHFISIHTGCLGVPGTGPALWSDEPKRNSAATNPPQPNAAATIEASLIAHA